MATVEHAMWVTKKYPALNNQVGFVKVPAAMRATILAAGGALDTFDHLARVTNDPAVTDLALTAVAVAADAAVGTAAGTASATGGTPPFTFSLVDNDDGNFAITGTGVKTAKTPLAVGPHEIALRVADAKARNRVEVFTITVTAAAPEGAARSSLLSRKSKS